MQPLTALVGKAGEAIMAERRAGMAVRAKADRSPVTAADEAAEAVLLEGLARLMPGVPVVSEEQVAAGHAPALGDLFVLVDPLDGTREFVDGHDEFTVNVAVIVAGAPVAGLVGVPAQARIWRGLAGGGAERVVGDLGTPIRARPWPGAEAVGLASRSHLDPASAALLARLGLTPTPCGSALKFCRLAEGAADVYARLAPTSQWDIAAGHAVLAAAGGVVACPDGSNISYGDGGNSGAAPRFGVPAFVACGDPALLPMLVDAP
jgi:3'(2'), 5'-bisphosphate nucleotidase